MQIVELQVAGFSSDASDAPDSPEMSSTKKLQAMNLISTIENL